MKFDDVVTEWTKDAEIDIYDIAEEVRRVPKLHGKYLGYLIEYKQKAKAIDLQLATAKRDLTDYYMGRAEKPAPVRIIKTEAPTYIAADERHQAIEARLEHARIAVDYLQRVLKMIESRGFELKTAMEWQRFSSGR